MTDYKKEINKLITEKGGDFTHEMFLVWTK